MSMVFTEARGSDSTTLSSSSCPTNSGPLTRNTLLYNIVFIFLGMLRRVAFAIMINELTNKVFKKDLPVLYVPALLHFVGSGTGDFPGDFWI